MKKIKYNKQEMNLVDRLDRLIGLLEAERRSVTEVTDRASEDQLELLAKLGIRPKWQATRQEAYEMICHYRLILKTNRIP
ncbi:MAG: hypothetical protein ABFD79_06195 [Phycisphaerales bacterium]